MSGTTTALDINEVFRNGGRSVEFLDEINKASVVMLDKTRIVPNALARKIAAGIVQGIVQVIAQRQTSPLRSADYLEQNLPEEQ